MSDIYEVLEIASKVWQINDKPYNKPYNVSMYLIEGTEYAALIDSGNTEGNLLEFVRTLTSKPIKLVILHGHGDHAANINQFDEVYIPHEDVDMLNEWFDFKVTKSDVFDLRAFDEICLGDCTLELVPLPGHTPGSVVVLERSKKLLFTSDAIGSGGIWMQLANCRPLTEYYRYLCVLDKKIEDIDGLRILVGHPGKLGRSFTHDYFNDIKCLTKLIIDGDVVGEPTEDPNDFFGGYNCSYGKVSGYIYKPSNIE